MLALIIFLLTLLGILTRPFKLKIWVFSSVGAADRACALGAWEQVCAG